MNNDEREIKNQTVFSSSLVNFEQMSSARSACLNHAEDLLIAARALQNLEQKNLPHIAYHLATLALEEIGKAGLLVVAKMSTSSEASTQRLQKSVIDHVKKLFWAFLGGSFGTQVITNELIKSFEGIATRIHEKRLQGLYVDGVGDDISVPSKTVTSEDADHLIALAFSRLQMEKVIPLSKLSEEAAILLSWFAEKAEDPEKRRAFFSRASMTKLVEKKTVSAWISWLKEQDDEEQRHFVKLAEKEINRLQPHGSVADELKWKLKIRLFSGSHSIRSKALSMWNESSERIKLHAVDGKKHRNELLVEFRMPKRILINQVWLYGWYMARHFVTALNIGSLGYFWWHLPQQVSRYYESLVDLDENAEVRLDRSPVLKLNWGNKVLTEKDLANTSLCFAAIPTSNGYEMEPFNYYIGGLTFLGINDIHWQCEANAFINFYKSLKSAMKLYGEYQSETDFLACFKGYFRDMTSSVADDIQELYELGEALANGAQQDKTITLEEVGKIKIFSDAYFLQTFRKQIQEIRIESSKRS